MGEERHGQIFECQARPHEPRLPEACWSLQGTRLLGNYTTHERCDLKDYVLIRCFAISLGRAWGRARQTNSKQETTILYFLRENINA